MQQPGDGNLSRRRSIGDSDLPHSIRRLDIPVEVGTLKTRIVPAIIVLRIVLRAFDTAGKKAAPERGEWHQSDAQLPQDRDDIRLQMALPKRVLGLQHRNRTDRMRPANRGGRGLRQTEIANLAGTDQIRNGPGDIFDRDGRIDTMLVQKIDPVRAQPHQHCIDGLPYVFRPAVEADDLPVLDVEAELVGDDDVVAPLAQRPTQ